MIGCTLFKMGIRSRKSRKNNDRILAHEVKILKRSLARISSRLSDVERFLTSHFASLDHSKDESSSSNTSTLLRKRFSLRTTKYLNRPLPSTSVGQKSVLTDEKDDIDTTEFKSQPHAELAINEDLQSSEDSNDNDELYNVSSNSYSSDDTVESKKRSRTRNQKKYDKTDAMSVSANEKNEEPSTLTMDDDDTVNEDSTSGESGPLTSSCEECGKVLKGLTSHDLKKKVQAHRKIHSSSDLLNTPCKECGKVITGSNKKYLNCNLYNHMKIHSSRSSFPCLHCPSSYTRKSDLKRHHINSHTTISRYVCDVCGKGFNEASYFRAHQTIHNSEKPFPCSKCDKRFSASIYVKTHIKKVHNKKNVPTGEKLLCSVCNSLYKTKRSLQRHVLRIHPESDLAAKYKPKKIIVEQDTATEILKSVENPVSNTRNGDPVLP